MAHALPQGPLGHVLDRLEKVKRNGSGWVARCPAHQDRNPSLSITEGSDGRVLLNCHAGCTFDNIISAIGLQPTDLFEEREQKRREIIAEYNYTDEQGTMLFQAVRMIPKDFRQRRPDGQGGWIWSLGETRRVVYKLPKVREAIANGRTIYVTEGEKDADILTGIGLTATTNPMGAGKWRDEYTSQLNGAAGVIIIADNDEPGRKHAQDVSASLVQAGIRNRIMVAATGKDATDHLAANHTIDELVPLLPVTDPPPASPIVVETWLRFVALADEDIPCLVEGLWPEGSLGFIASPPKKGKTWIGLSLALSVALGLPYLSEFDVNTPRPVLYLALEGHRSALMHRIAALARGMGHDPAQQIPNLHIAYKPRGINIADPVWAEHVLTSATETEASLVIVDVLRAAARIKENDASDFADMRSNLSPILDDNRSVGLLHHFTKMSETSKERTPMERMSGSGAMGGAMDIGIFITGSDDGARKLRLEFTGRDIAMPDTTGVFLEGHGTGRNGGFSARDRAWWRPTEAPTEDDLVAPVDELVTYIVQADGDVYRQHLVEHFGISDDTLDKRSASFQEHGITKHKIGRQVAYRANPETGQGEL